MFDKGIGGIVEPFNFTEEQRQSIVQCFGGSQRRKTKKSEKANEFIARLEPIIEFWISLKEEPRCNNSELESRLNQIAKQCEQLMQAVSEVDKKTSNGLGIELCFYNRKKSILLSEYDTATAINSLMAVSQELAQRINQRSTTKAAEKELALMMAYCYWCVFEKFPGWDEESNFSLVVQAVVGVLGVSIGKTIIKKSVKEIKKGKTPPFFS